MENLAPPSETSTRPPVSSISIFHSLFLSLLYNLNWFSLCVCFWVEQKRPRAHQGVTENQTGKANGDRAGEANEFVDRESSPEDFEELRPKSKRSRASEGTSASAHKANDLSLIGMQISVEL